MIATLARRVGVHHIETIEDAVQSALMTALDRWMHVGVPDRPSACIFRFFLPAPVVVQAARSSPSRRPSEFGPIARRFRHVRSICFVPQQLQQAERFR